MKLPIKTMATTFLSSLVFAGSVFAHGNEEPSKNQEEIETLNRVIVQGEVFKKDVMPEKIGGTIFVPLRYVAENYGVNVTWAADTRTAKLEKKEHKTSL